MPGDSPLGYTDTPKLLDQPWRVHDIDRPCPEFVEPGCCVGQPPADAVVLFDGTDLSGWKGADGPAQWLVKDGYMEVTHTGDITSMEEYGDAQLHIEFAAPEEIIGSSQGRGNSGIFLQGLYEIQVLDNYDNPTYSDGLTGAIYGQFPPLVNPARKPGEWQQYDIFFRAPRFGEDGKVSEPAVVTVMLNGVLLHHARPIHGPTAHKILNNYEGDIPAKGPLKLQDHGGDKVRFRNIWIRHLAPYPGLDELL